MPDALPLRVGLIGMPLGHTLSPVMFQAAFQHVGLNWQYLPLPVRPEALADAVRGLLALDFAGFNVTIPHKQAVMPLLARVKPRAAAIGAVNLVTRTPEGWQGDNSDADGWRAALMQHGFVFTAKTRAVVAGAGGAARAVIYAMLECGVCHITIANRSAESAAKLIADFGQIFPLAELTQVKLDVTTLVEAVHNSDLLVNTTPLGCYPHDAESIWQMDAPIPKTCVVSDLVYRPLATKLLLQARASGAMAVDGLEMLLHQGAAAFKAWTGQDAPLDVMRIACHEALRREA